MILDTCIEIGHTNGYIHKYQRLSYDSMRSIVIYNNSDIGKEALADDNLYSGALRKFEACNPHGK